MNTVLPVPCADLSAVRFKTPAAHKLVGQHSGDLRNGLALLILRQDMIAVGRLVRAIDQHPVDFLLGETLGSKNKSGGRVALRSVNLCNLSFLCWEKAELNVCLRRLV